MAWQSTYTHAIAIAADMFGSALLFSNQGEDITISSWCGLELRKLKQPHPPAQVNQALVSLGRFLNRLDTDHCEKAITADTGRINSAYSVLTSVSKP